MAFVVLAFVGGFFTGMALMAVVAVRTLPVEQDRRSIESFGRARGTLAGISADDHRRRQMLRRRMT